MPSRLIVVPAKQQISPVIGFIQPSTARDILVTRQPGKVGRDRIMIQYIVAPSGYDPRNPFIRGAEIGHVIFQVIAVDGEPKNGPDTAAKGRIVSKIGQEWYKKVSEEEDKKLEKRIADLFYPTKEQIRSLVRKKSSQLSWETNSSTSAKAEKKSKDKKESKEGKKGKRERKSPEGTELLDSMPIQQFSDDDDKKESEVDESKDEREPSERKDVEAKCDEENKEAQMTAIEAIANLPSEEDNGDDEEEYVYGTGVPQVRSERVLKQKKGKSTRRDKKSQPTPVESAGPSHPPRQLASEPSSSGAPSGGAQKIKYKEVDHYIEEQYLCGRDVGGAEEYVIFMPTGATSSSKNNNSNCRGQSDGNKGNNDRGQSNGSGSNVGAKDPTASSYAFL